MIDDKLNRELVAAVVTASVEHGVSHEDIADTLLSVASVEIMDWLIPHAPSESLAAYDNIKSAMMTAAMEAAQQEVRRLSSDN